MPTLGEKAKGNTIGKVNPYCWYSWTACDICGKERWVKLTFDKLRNTLCLSCSRKGQQSGNWKGGRYHHSAGYICIRAIGHHRADGRGYALEHILVWEKAHNQKLPEGYVVHHINGVKDDNRPSNLVALTPKRHNEKHESLLQVRAQRIRELEQEIKLLEKALGQSQMIFRLEEN